VWAARADALERAGRTADAARAFQYALTLDEQSGDPATLGVDWFNYGQLLRRQQTPAPLVLACLMRAETLLTSRADARADTVQRARSEVEHEHPDAVVIGPPGAGHRAHRRPHPLLTLSSEPCPPRRGDE
jgi:hypothetical protein